MKKVVSFLGLCALVALAFTSCKKNETNSVTFKATLSQPASNNRTHIEAADNWGNCRLIWNGDESIKLFDRTKTENNSSNFEVDGFNGQQAYFKGDASFLSTITTANNYIAFYPNAVETPNGVEMVISNQQVWDNGTFANHVYPMFGFNNSDAEIEFQSHAGVLGLLFKLDPNVYTESIALDKIVLAGGDVLCGTMVYDLDGNYTQPLVNPGNTIELDCTATTLVNDGWREFYIVLPEGALEEAFTVTILTQDGRSLTYEAKSEAEGGQAIQAEHITWMERCLIKEPFVTPE